VRASVVRDRARQLLGRDSESLSERNFVRILKDAHDADVLDLRRRGDDFEVARAEAAAPVSEQLARSQPAPPEPVSAAASGARLSIRGRMSGPTRGRLPSAPPPELLSVGIVEMPSRGNSADGHEAEVPAARKRGRKRPSPKNAEEASTDESSAPRAAKRSRRSRAKKGAAKSTE